MTNESALFLELWELVRDSIQPARRYDVAVGMFRAFEESGYDKREFRDLKDETQDATLTRAFQDVFEEDEEEEDEYDYESLDSEKED